VKRTIKITIEIDPVNEFTFTGKELIEQMIQDFVDVVDASTTVNVTLDTEYDE
jgi:hypothetical protein